MRYVVIYQRIPTDFRPLLLSLVFKLLSSVFECFLHFHVFSGKSDDSRGSSFIESNFFRTFMNKQLADVCLSGDYYLLQQSKISLPSMNALSVYFNLRVSSNAHTKIETNLRLELG